MDCKEKYLKWMNSGVLNEEETAELSRLGEKEIAERFTGKPEFGTAGMRGIMALGENNINRFTVRRATKGLADFIIKEKKENMGVAVSYDTRKNSYAFALEAASVLACEKIKVYLFENVRPVPMLSFAVRELKCAAGIMITASHNPKEYNGYKVYGEDGAQLPPESSAEISEYIDRTPDVFSVRTEDFRGSEIEFSAEGCAGRTYFGRVNIIGADIDNKYYEIIDKLSVTKDLNTVLADTKIVYSPLYGAGYKPVTTVLTRMGISFSVVKEQSLPNGDFPTVSAPNPEQPDALRLGIKEAEKSGADCVIATDPDCDRMGVAVRDAGGKFVVLNGNTIGVLLTDYILKVKSGSGKLPADSVVIKTIVTSELARAVAEYYGVKCIDVLTGFKFIGEKIRQYEEDGSQTFIFGFEESYGYLCGTHSRDKDAVVASMLFAEMVRYYKSLGETVLERLAGIYKLFGWYKEENITVNYPGINGIAEMNGIMEKLRNASVSEIAGREIVARRDYSSGLEFKHDGVYPIELPRTNAVYYKLLGGAFVCIRPSGTEPKLKIYVSVRENSREAADKSAAKIGKAMVKILEKNR